MSCATWSHWMDFLKDVGPTLGIAGAVVAWLVNKFLGWFVWAAERFLKRYELMNALLAEIISNSLGEQAYHPDPTASDDATKKNPEKFIASLRDQVGPYEPIAPYVAVVTGNPVYESALTSLSLLPGWVVKPFVRYYSASVALMNQLSDFRSEAFLALNQTRQRTVITLLWNSIGREVETSTKQAKFRLRAMLAIYQAIRYVAARTAIAILWIMYVLGMKLWPAAYAAITQAVEWVQSCPMPSPSKP